MVRIRVEQTSLFLGRVKDNLDAHLDLLEKATREEIQVLVFPELSLSGYLLKDLVPDVALTRTDLLERLRSGRGKIRDLEAAIGFAEESPEHRFFNSVAFVRWDSQGRADLVHVHRKIHLPTYGLFDEGRYYAPGRRIRAFESRFLGRCGILICEDAWHLSLPLLLAVDGPEFDGVGAILLPSNSPARGVGAGAEGVPESHRTWEGMIRTYASLLGTMVIYANRAGVEDGLTFTGGSQISAPGGGCLAKAAFFEPATLDVEVDWPTLFRNSRVGSPLQAANDVDFIRRELERLIRREEGE
jgi:predicted amidohydrolase